MLPGTRDRNSTGKERGSLFERAMAGHLGSVISSMGRWRMRLIVPRAEIAEMLPLARLLSRSTDPAAQSRSKVSVMELVVMVVNCMPVFLMLLIKYITDAQFSRCLVVACLPITELMLQ